MTITLKGISEENFQDYRKASLFLAFPKCSFKCCKEKGYDISICQNNSLTQEEPKEIDLEYIYNLYTNNCFTEAFVLGGLEPLDSFDDVLKFIKFVRETKCDMSEIVIYTGYYVHEIPNEINDLRAFKNIILKCGRYVADASKRYDDILGIELISDNQYGIRVDDLKLKTSKNSDTELYEIANKQVKENQGYCPCILNSIGKEEYKCPCKNFREQNISGECHCGLLEKKWIKE